MKLGQIILVYLLTHMVFACLDGQRQTITGECQGKVDNIDSIACPNGCKSCNENDVCSECFHPGYYTLINGECSSCSSGNLSLIQTDGTCLDTCDGCGEQCVTLNSQVKCVTCPEGEFLDTSTYTCSQTACSDISIPKTVNGISFTICKDLSGIYVSNNALPIEMGTQEFPYFELNQAIAEDNFYLKSKSTTIFLEENQHAYMDSDIPAFIDAAISMTIETNCNDPDNCQKNYLILAKYTNNRAIWKAVDESPEGQLSAGVISQELYNKMNTYPTQELIISDTQVTFKNIQIETDDPNKGLLLAFGASNIEIDSCDIRLSEKVILAPSELTKSIVLKDNIINSIHTEQFLSVTNTQCSDISTQQIIIKGNQFSEDERTWGRQEQNFINIQTTHQVNIEDNTFNTYYDDSLDTANGKVVNIIRQCESAAQETMVNNEFKILTPEQGRHQSVEISTSSLTTAMNNNSFQNSYSDGTLISISNSNDLSETTIMSLETISITCNTLLYLKSTTTQFEQLQVSAVTSVSDVFIIESESVTFVSGSSLVDIEGNTLFNILANSNFYLLDPATISIFNAQCQNVFLFSTVQEFQIEGVTLTQVVSDQYLLNVASFIGEGVSFLRDVTYSQDSTINLFVNTGAITTPTHELRISNISLISTINTSTNPIINLGRYSQTETEQTLINISNVLFENINFISGGSPLQIKNTLLSFIMITECKFLNLNAQLKLSNVDNLTNPQQMQFLDCQMIGNYPGSLPFVNPSGHTYIWLNQCLIQDNSSTNRGGIATATKQGGFPMLHLRFEGCLIQNNYAKQGGVAFVIQVSVDIIQCEVKGNFAMKSGLFVAGGGSVYNFATSEIKENKALAQALLEMTYLKKESIDFVGCVLQDNVQLDLQEFMTDISTDLKSEQVPFLSEDILQVIIGQGDKLDQIAFATISCMSLDRYDMNFIDCQFYQHTDLFTLISSTVLIQNSSFENITLEKKPLIYQKSSSLTLDNVNLTNISGLIDKFIIQLTQSSELTLSNATQISNLAKVAFVICNDSVVKIQSLSQIHTVDAIETNKPFIKIYQSEIYTSSTTLSSISTSSSSTPLIEARKSIVSLGQSTIFSLIQGLIISTSESTLTINGVTVEDTEEFVKMSIMRGIVEVNGGEFYRVNGRVIDSTNSVVEVTNSKFQDNTSNESGTCINLHCEINFEGDCSSIVQGNEFKGNQALMYGASISYDLFQPHMMQQGVQSNTFEGNVSPYGQDVAGYPFKLELDHELLDLVAPGQRVTQFLQVNLLDQEGQIISNDNSSKAIIKAQNLEISEVSGFSEVTAVNGVYRFDDISLIAAPGSKDVKFIIESSAIDIDKLNVLEESGVEVSSSIELEISFRYCVEGEMQKDDKCEVCPSGRYSLQANSTDCLLCPPNSICPGGSTIVLNEGYWRSSVLSDQIYACEISESCLGGSGSEAEPVECAQGHEGRLCTRCFTSQSETWARSGEFACSECDYSNQVLVIVGVVIVLFASILVLIVQVYFCYYSRINLRKAKDSVNSILFRILTNYFQVVSMSAAYDMEWPAALKETFGVVNVVSQSSQQSLSIDCFLQDGEFLLFNFLESRDPQDSIFYTKTLYTALLPFGIILIFAFFWTLVSPKFGGVQFRNKAIVVTVIVVCFLIHPTLLELTFSLFNCKSIGDSLYFYKDLEIECWQGSHSTWSIALGVPLIVVWVLGIPAFGFFILYKNQSRLTEPEFLGKYRMMYQGYKAETFYWEFVNTIRKLSLILVNVFMSQYTKSTQALTAMVLLLIPMYYQLKKKPFKVNTFNMISFREAIVSFLTLYGGTFFVQDDTTQVAKVLIIIILISLNIWFFLSWGLVYIQQPFIRKLLARCCGCSKNLLVPNNDLQAIMEMSGHTETSQTKVEEESKVQTPRSQKKRTIPQVVQQPSLKKDAFFFDADENDHEPKLQIGQLQGDEMETSKVYASNRNDETTRGFLKDVSFERQFLKDWANTSGIANTKRKKKKKFSKSRTSHPQGEMPQHLVKKKQENNQINRFSSKYEKYNDEPDYPPLEKSSDSVSIPGFKSNGDVQDSVVVKPKAYEETKQLNK